MMVFGFSSIIMHLRPCTKPRHKQRHPTWDASRVWRASASSLARLTRAFQATARQKYTWK